MGHLFFQCRMEGPNPYLCHMNYANDLKPSPEVPPVDPKFLPRPKNISGFEMICIIHKAQIAVGTFHTALKEQVPHNL